MADLISRLRALSRHEHSDYSIGDEAADALEAAREDAERYRWLRAQNVIAVTSHDQSVDYQRDDLDAAIDAAREAEGKEGKEVGNG